MVDEFDRIGFLVHHPEWFHHYSNVWQHMPAGSVEVAITGNPKIFDTIAKGCESYGVPWRRADEMIRNKQRYTTFVSLFPAAVNGTQSSPLLTKSLGRFSVRFMYGNGKAGWNFSPWNSIYDSILCFGPYQAENLNSFQNAAKIQMGYPRFDHFFGAPIDRAQRLTELGLDPRRQTVVWLPTWRELCSIDAFASAVADLQFFHNVIVKPHPGTLSQAKQMEKLEPFRCVIRESMNNAELFQLADLLLCDYGGSAFGGIYTDRKVVLLDLPDAAAHKQMGQKSSDIELRQYIPHVAAEEAEMLGLFLTDEADSIWADQPRVRSVLREYHFAPYYGFSSQVAALAITNAPRAPRKHA